MKQPRKYPKEFKIDACNLVLKDNLKSTIVAKTGHPSRHALSLDSRVL